jgi:myosin heavy subunit
MEVDGDPVNTSEVFLRSNASIIMMESIRALKENPQLARELAEALMPYIIESEEYKLITETRDRLNALVDNMNRVWDAINKNSEEIRILQNEIKELHKENRTLWEAVSKNSEEIKRMQEEIRQLQEESKMVQQEIRQLQEESKMVQQEIRQLQEESKMVQQEIRQLQEESKMVQQEIRQLQEESKMVQQEIRQLQEESKMVQQEIRQLQEENGKLWVAVNRNSEDIRLLHEDHKKIWEAIYELTKSLQRLDVTVGSFTGRAGIYMEKTMLELYREALSLHGIDVSKVKSVKLVDETGVVWKGRTFQVDILEEDGVTYLFEIKNYGDESVLEQVFTRRAILESMGKKVKAFIVANIMEDKVRLEAESQGVTVIAGHTIEVQY